MDSDRLRKLKAQFMDLRHVVVDLEDALTGAASEETRAAALETLHCALRDLAVFLDEYRGAVKSALDETKNS